MINKIGRYEIKQELGRGGMATVYLAHDPLFGRDVAVKMMRHTGGQDEMFRARFQREARTVASLEHPAIVPVHDFGEQDNQPFLVMAYMPGGTLEDRLAQGVMSPSEALTILQRLGPALDQAHRQGIIHRDLKPANILFDRYNNAYLSDFGIVKVQEATANLTGDLMIGTPAYMSPEQARGDSAMDGRSDIYSLGAILFTMLTGRLPYEAETPMGIAMKHITAPVPSILSQNPGLPPGIDTVVRKAMAKAPNDRYRTATQFTNGLDHAISQGSGATEPGPDAATIVEPGAASIPMRAAQPPPSAPPPAAASSGFDQSPPQKRLPFWAYALIGLFLGGCLIGLVVGGFAFFYPPDATPTRSIVVVTGVTPVADSATATTTPAPGPSDTPDAGSVSGGSDDDDSTNEPVVDPPADTATATASPTPTPTATATFAPAAQNGPIVYDSAEDVGFEIFMMEPDGSSVRRLTNNTVRDDEADLSSDSTLIAYESQDGSDWTIMIMDSAGNDQREVTAGRQPDWSPDDTLIAFESTTSPQHIFTVDVISGDIRQLTSGSTNNRAPSWSPDGAQIVYMTEVGGVWQLAILNVNNGVTRQITQGSVDKRFPVWSPDGAQIAYNTLTQTGAPDHIWIVDVDGENPTRLTSEGQNGRPGWSPDGRYIVFNSQRSGEWLIYRMDRDGSNQIALTNVGPDQRADWGGR